MVCILYATTDAHQFGIGRCNFQVKILSLCPASVQHATSSKQLVLTQIPLTTWPFDIEDSFPNSPLRGHKE